MAANQPIQAIVKPVKRSSPALAKAKATLEKTMELMKKRVHEARIKHGLTDEVLMKGLVGGAAVVVLDYVLGDTIRNAFGEYAQYAIPAVAGLGGFLLWKKGGSMKGIGMGLMVGGAFVLVKQLFLPDTTPKSDTKAGVQNALGYGPVNQNNLALRQADTYHTLINDEASGDYEYERDDDEIDGIQDDIEGIQAEY